MVKTKMLPEVWEKSGDQIVIGFGAASDWFRGWQKVSIAIK